MQNSAPRIVLLGGGTGSYELLLGLKELTPHITAVVNMCDDGGSTGRLRRDYNVSPPGDVRQCLAALATNSDAERLFSHRFDGGDLGGHAAGNIILAALELQSGSFMQAVDVVSKMLGCIGRVLPVTNTKHILAMQDGEMIIKGQESVRLHHTKDQVRVWLEPHVEINHLVRDAILEADMVIIAPGGLNWTLLPLCAVGGVQESLQQTKGQVVCVTNLMNRPEQHKDWHVVDYVLEFNKYIGEGTIDTVVYHNGSIPTELIDQYATAGEGQVRIDAERFSELGIDSVGADLAAGSPKGFDPADEVIDRTHIRHDGRKTADTILRILEETSSNRR